MKYALLVYKGLFGDDQFCVGPFDSEEDADKWLDENDQLIRHYQTLQIDLIPPDKVAAVLRGEEI